MTDEELDNELLKNVGDTRKIRKEGKINDKKVDLEIERTRNDKGGVDVKINVLTPFSISSKTN